MLLLLSRGWVGEHSIYVRKEDPALTRSDTNGVDENQTATKWWWSKITIPSHPAYVKACGRTKAEGRRCSASPRCPQKDCKTLQNKKSTTTSHYVKILKKSVAKKDRNSVASAILCFSSGTCWIGPSSCLHHPIDVQYHVAEPRK